MLIWQCLHTVTLSSTCAAQCNCAYNTYALLRVWKIVASICQNFSQFLHTVCLGCGVCTPQYKKAAGIPYYIASVLALNRVADVEGKIVCTVGAVVTV